MKNESWGVLIDSFDSIFKKNFGKMMLQFNSSTGALSLKKIPESIVMICGGVIGLELVNYLNLINQINFILMRNTYLGFCMEQTWHKSYMCWIFTAHRWTRSETIYFIYHDSNNLIFWLILKGIDMEVSKAFQKILVKQGIQFKLEQKVVAADKSGDKIRVDIESVKNPENKSSVNYNKSLWLMRPR